MLLLMAKVYVMAWGGCKSLDVLTNFINNCSLLLCGPGSSVGMTTGYGLDGPRFESWWGGEIFRTCPDRPWGPHSLLYNGYRAFLGGKERPEGDPDPSPPSSAVVKKG